MKRLLFVILITIPALGFTQKRFPDYREVLTKFFSLYHHDNSIREMLNFARKKDGWYVQIINSTKQDELSSEQIFWSLQKGRYQVLENFVGANKEPVEIKVNNQISASYYFPYGYERCIYFGYDGWDADVIRDFEQAANPGDTLLESLARAYSYYCTRFTWYQYGGHALPNDTLQIKLDRVQLPGDERVKKVAEYADKAIAAYEKIYRRNKSYETFGGNIESKLFDETFHACLQMMLCHRPAEAEKFLNKCRLPQTDSLTAQKIFSLAKPNAIVFTFGDNDTYPLYYLQEKQHIRNDITVVHASLLGLPPYIELLKRKGNLSFTSTAAQYGKKDYDYAFFSGRPSGKTIKISDFVSNRKNFNKVPAMGGDSVQVYNEKNLYMPFSPQKDSLRLRLNDQLYLGEFIMLDIVANNLNQRPIYFTSPWSMIPSENMAASGNLWQLVPRQ
jgi:hypothetical protein